MLGGVGVVGARALSMFDADNNGGATQEPNQEGTADAQPSGDGNATTRAQPRTRRMRLKKPDVGVKRSDTINR